MKLAKLLALMLVLALTPANINVSYAGNNFGSGDCRDVWCADCKCPIGSREAPCVENCMVCWDGYYWRPDCSPCGRMC